MIGRRIGRRIGKSLSSAPLNRKEILSSAPLNRKNPLSRIGKILVDFLKGERRSAKRHYPTMPTKAIAALPVGELAYKSSTL
jgi:hypothetical protein